MWSSLVGLVPTLWNPVARSVAISCTLVNYMSQAEQYFCLIVRALLEWDTNGLQWNEGDPD